MLDAVNSVESADVADVGQKKTTSTMLFNHLFETCNILRDPINQDEFKTYVIPLLFFKRVSDTYDEETQIAYENMVRMLPISTRTRFTCLLFPKDVIGWI